MVTRGRVFGGAVVYAFHQKAEIEPWEDKLATSNDGVTLDPSGAAYT